MYTASITAVNFTAVKFTVTVAYASTVMGAAQYGPDEIDCTGLTTADQVKKAIADRLARLNACLPLVTELQKLVGTALQVS